MCRQQKKRGDVVVQETSDVIISKVVSFALIIGGREKEEEGRGLVDVECWISLYVPFSFSPSFILNYTLV